MKKSLLKTVLILIFFLNLSSIYSQIIRNTPDSILLTIKNVKYKDKKTFEFDIYLYNKALVPRSIEAVQLNIRFNSSWRNGGKMDTSWLENNVFFSPHTLIETGLENSPNFGGTTTTLINTGAHLKYTEGSEYDFLRMQTQVVTPKSRGILVNANTNLYIGKIQLVNTQNFDTTEDDVNWQFNFPEILSTAIAEDTVILGKIALNSYILYQPWNALVKPQSPIIQTAILRDNYIEVNFTEVKKVNGLYTGSYDTVDVVKGYKIEGYDAMGNKLVTSYSAGSPARVSNLQLKNYRFKVSAFNEADTSIQSAYSNEIVFINSYTLTAEAQNGTVTPTNAVVLMGDSQTFKYQPNPNYYLQEIYIDNKFEATASTDSLYQYTFNAISANHNLLVHYDTIPRIVLPDTLSYCNFTTVDTLLKINNNYLIYDSINSSIPLPADTVLRTKKYYIRNSVKGFISNFYDSVFIKINNPIRPILLPFEFCSNSNPTISLLNQEIIGNVLWFNSLTSQAPLPTTQSLTNATYFYIFTEFGCNSDRGSVEVSLVNPLTIPKLNDTTFCGTDQTFNNLYPQYTSLIWFRNNNLTDTLRRNDLLVDGTKYYYISVNSVCVSPIDSVKVSIIQVNSIKLRDTSFCISTLPKVGNLFNKNVRWFSNRLGLDSLNPTVELISQTYYYRGYNGICEGNIDSINVVIDSVPKKIKIANQQFCKAAMVINLQPTRPDLFWYDRLPATQPLLNTTLLKTGKYYYLLKNNQCSSAIDSINVNSIAAPGKPVVNFETGDSLLRLTFTTVSAELVDSFEINISPGGLVYKIDSTGLSLKGLLPGTYSATVRSINCSGISEADTVNNIIIYPYFNIITSVAISGSGTISPSTKVRSGSSYRVTYQANTLNNYIFDTVEVNANKRYDSMTGYTFNNIRGDSTIKIYFTKNIKPTAPVIVSAIGKYHSIELSLTQPNYPGPSVLYYKVYNYYTSEYLGSYKGTTILLSNLTKDTLYQFYVVGVNKFGESVRSNPSPATKPIIGVDNILIQVYGATCRDLKDGILQVSIVNKGNYAFNLVTTNFDTSGIFADTINRIRDLKSGTYLLSIFSPGSLIPTEFTFTISEPNELTSLQSSELINNKISLGIAGGNHYFVYNNGKLISEILANENVISQVNVNLNIGVNTIVIKTDKQCQDSIVKRVINYGEVYLYPNPGTDKTNIYLGNKINGIIKVSIYNEAGQYLSEQQYAVKENGEISLNTSDLVKGLYLIKVTGENFNATLKFVKK